MSISHKNAFDQPVTEPDKLSIYDVMLQTLTDHQLWDFRSRLVLAVSGGRDSMVMMNAFLRLATDPQGQLIIAHIDHGVRPESSLDAAFVEAAACNAGLPFICRKLEAGLPSNGRSPEDFWRSERYRILLEIRARAGASAVATAHTATDHLETILLRLTAGTGPRGLLGIRFHRKDGVIRPMLEITREEIARFADANEIRWREDCSNADISRPRNAIRHSVIPALRAINPEVERAAVRGSSLLAEEDNFLSELARNLLLASGWKDTLPAILQTRFFITEPAALTLRCAAAVYSALSGSTGFRTEAAHIRALANCFVGKASHCPLPGGASAHSAADNVVLIPKVTDEDRERVIQIPFTGPHVIGAFRVEMVAESVLDLSPSDPLLVDAVRIRTRRPGDRFFDAAKGTQMKLSDFMRTSRIPVPLRKFLPVIVDSSERVIWVSGVHGTSTGLVASSGNGRTGLTCRPVWAIR